MRKINKFIVIFTAVMLFSFAAAPPADAIVLGTLTVILFASMATAIVATEAVKRSKSESASDHHSSEQMTTDNLQASGNTGE
jgi:flagellar biosynthesis component FlhA